MGFLDRIKGVANTTWEKTKELGARTADAASDFTGATAVRQHLFGGPGEGAFLDQLKPKPSPKNPMGHSVFRDPNQAPSQPANNPLNDLPFNPYNQEQKARVTDLVRRRGFIGDNTLQSNALQNLPDNIFTGTDRYDPHNQAPGTGYDPNDALDRPARDQGELLALGLVLLLLLGGTS